MAIEIINTKADFDEKVKEGKYLVDFYATWCGPCKMIAPVLDEISPQLEADGVNIIKIDVDEAQEIAMQYGVMSVPTLVVIENGNQLAVDQGFKPGEALIEWVKSV